MSKFLVCRTRRLGVARALLILMMAGLFSAKAAEVYLEVGGLLVIEAEGYHSKDNTSARDWYIFPATGTPTPDPDGPHATGTGGGKYVEILPDTRTTHDDVLEIGTNYCETGAGAPRVNYQVSIATPGRYYARIRAYSTGTEDNGVHIGVNDTWPESGTAVQWCDGKNSWYWSGARRVPEDHCGITNGIYLDLTAGIHTIMIAMREDGFEMDRFVLTTDPNYFPTGIGPAASPVSSGGNTAQIVTQPQSPVNLLIGDTLTLSVTATGTEPITYQWTKGGVNIPGATSAVYTKTNVQESDSGSYAVRVTNPSGTVTSSSSQVTVTPFTLWNIVESTPELSMFKAAIQAAGLVPALRQGTLTLFTPNNAAFASLPAGVWDEVLANPNQLLSVLSYHALDDIKTTVELVPGLYPTLQGSDVVVTVPGAGVLMVNTAEVIEGDLVASNGVAHVIDAVLLPDTAEIVTQPQSPVTVVIGGTLTLSVTATGTGPITYQWTKGGVNIVGATSATYTKTNVQESDSGTYAVKVTNPSGTVTSSNSQVSVGLPTLWRILDSTEELSTFKAAMEAAGLVQTLGRQGSLTLFAPTDAAFAALPEGVWDAVLADPELLLAVLSYHGVAGGRTTAELAPGLYQTVQGSNVLLTLPEVGVLMVNEAEVIDGDQLASNGVAHLIDAVLLLPESLQIVTQPETLVAAYVGDTITLAVEATGAEPIQYQWTKDGVDLEGATSATFVKADAQVSDSGLYAVKITSPGGTATSSDAAVTVVPPLWDIVASTAELSTFKAAIEAAGLIRALQQGSLTLFVPTDAAFEALAEGVWDEVLADPERLLAALSYHALDEIMTTVELVPGNYPTVQGWDVVVTVPEAGVLMVNDAEVINGDLLASNGVAHVIDAVLLLDPPQIVTQPETPVGAYVAETITLSVEATGAEPIQYQWTKDGVDLEGTTSATLVKADAQVSDSGLYAVKVTNPGGTVTSIEAAVAVTVPTLWQILEVTEELSTLKAAVEAAGLVETMQGEEALTLFAPNNAAFDALPAGVWDALLANPEQLLGALKYHALAGSQTTADLESGDYETLNGASVTVTVGEVVMVNDAEVIAADQLASNGVAHVIDTVLLPELPQIVTQPETPVGAYVGDTITLSVEATGAEPIQYQWTKDGTALEGATSATFVKADAQVSDTGGYAVKVTNPGGTVTSIEAAVTVTVPTLWQLLEVTEELSTLKAAVEAAGLVETLQAEEAQTWFAPNNAAFEALPEGVWEGLLANPEQLMGALTYHALAGSQTTADLDSGDYETLHGESVTVTVTEVVVVNDAEVIVADLLASNGVVHVIDTVLLLEPPQIVTQPEPAVGAYVGDTITLSVEATGAEPIQFQWTWDGDDIAGATEAVFVKTNAQVSDSGSYAVKVTNPGGTITSGDAAVTVTVPTLWQLLEVTEDLSTFKAAVEAAGLVETLQAEEAQTWFAPNNAAFQALPEGVWEGLRNDPDQLLTLLTYHALAGAHTADDLEPGNHVTVQGSTVVVTRADEALLVNRATVILADTMALNGVVHRIDTVLQVPVPPAIVTPPEPNVSALAGDTVVLSVVATGDEPLAYQWTKDGVDLEGESGPTLTLTDAQVSDCGTYAVRLSNAVGSLTSPDSVVRVVMPPPVLNQPSIVDGNITITWTGGGEIETATDLNGPWVGTGNTSGLFVEVMETGNKYFRINQGE